MSETLVEQPAVEQPIEQVETQAPEVVEVSAPVSISDHEKNFGPQAKTAEPPTAQAGDAGADDAPLHPSAQQRRDKPTGQFAEGKKRGNSNPQVRINQLTARAKAAEERAAALERQFRAVGGVAPTAAAQPAQNQPQAAQAQPQAPPRYVDPRDPEPTPTDPKFGGDYGKYLNEQTRWAARDEYRQIQYQQYLGQQQQAQVQQKQARDQHWQTRLQKSMDLHPDDFEAVAFGTPTPWEKDSLVDALIEKHDNGTELLYYLQSHPQERDSILQMPEPKQVVALSQILLRFESTGGQPGVTGSGAPSNIRYLPPRPSNPVRTEAQTRASGTPPPTDGSLSIAEHQRRFGQQARRR